MSPKIEHVGSRLLRRARSSAARTLSGARRDHDRAMSDPQVAAEHRLQVERALSREEPGCPYCG